MSKATIVVRDSSGKESNFVVEQRQLDSAERIVREGVNSWNWQDKVKHDVTGFGKALGQRVVVRLAVDRDGQQTRSVADAVQALKQLLEGRGLSICRAPSSPDYAEREDHVGACQGWQDGEVGGEL